MLNIIEQKHHAKLGSLPKNIILMIGDGMSNGYVAAYRHYINQRNMNQLKPVAFEPYLIGQVMTHSHQQDDLSIVTDSAAAGTALSTGHKTLNGYVGVTPDGHKLTSVIEIAKEVGKNTGVVVTDAVTGGTPSAFLAHNITRNDLFDIADDIIDERVNGQIKIDVLMGGGLFQFDREDRNLVSEFVDAGYDFVETLDDLKESVNPKVLGLFARAGLFPLIDHPETQPTLAEMTQSALQRLQGNEQGFFLMIEGSQIDWGGHYSDPTYVMSEMKGFENTFKIVEQFAKEDGETLVIVTADHETGGLTLGAGGYFNPKYIHEMQRTSIAIANEIIETQNIQDTLHKYISWPLNLSEISAIEDALLPNGGGFTAICDILAAVVSTRAQVGWGTQSHSERTLSHSGEDVNIYAFGPGFESFKGVIDNTFIGQQMIQFIQA